MSMYSRRHAPHMAAAIARKGYVLCEKLGSGIYGDVRVAHKTGSPNVSVAIKIVCTSKASPEFVTKFFPRELNAIKTLRHPNIIEVHEASLVEWYRVPIHYKSRLQVHDVCLFTLFFAC